MLKVTTDRTPYYAGKPNAQIVKCMEQVGAKPEEVLVVGDRLYTDIACGINAGVGNGSCVYRRGKARGSGGDRIYAGLCI